MNYITDERIAPYKIGLDENQFHLIREYVTQTGKDIGSKYDITVGYYSSFQAVLTKLITLLVINTNYGSIQSYLNACKEQHFVLLAGFSEFLNQEKWRSLES